ncbi:hypothetical protein N3K66_003958 [Trichothecium roseum]|uniref:Uncharacterized protein n=1 Tax=Trichothecium roseum TaxID=47278 RepID=A0ACC0V6V9_9HYPO|nr:hypothetical protein N3K66_003958 [Trichothecium roseum]
MWSSSRVIDLTLDSSPAARPALITDELPPPDVASIAAITTTTTPTATARLDEPPAKRQRVGSSSNNGTSGYGDAFKKSLQTQVIPAIFNEATKLPNTCDKNSIARQVLSEVATTEDVVKHFRQYMCLQPDFERELVRRGVEGIRRVAGQGHAIPALPTPPVANSPKVQPTRQIRRKTIAPPKPTTVVEGKRPLRPLPRRQQRPKPTPGDRIRHTTLEQRPYRTREERDSIAKGVQRLHRGLADLPQVPIVYHVDFTQKEISQVLAIAKTYASGANLTLAALSSTSQLHIAVSNQLPGRSREDVRNFCDDIARGRTSTTKKVLSLQPGSADLHKERQASLRTTRTSNLLFARELEGNRGFGRMRSYSNFQNCFKMDLEDELGLIAEFTNCAGDVATISWVSNGGLICGATAHSDSHNQQYNKPGNFQFCSVAQGTLRAYADHRIPRPLVEKGENSTEAMRQSQDPWLYTSVVDSDLDFESSLAYTASFDRTVKVWRITEDDEGEDKTGMQCLATWPHNGNVNFVAAAKDGSGRVASAADVPMDAVRVYQVDMNDISRSPYLSFSGIRNGSESDAWAYYPATMRWGKAYGVQHLLLVGYSPRSRKGEDSDIPEDKRNTGAVALYDTINHRDVPVSTARSANVFEVAWHSTLPRFIAATSPCSLSVDPGVKTQILLFERDRDSEDERYAVYQALDCWAVDINELTFMSNSLVHAYVTAACTDGKVYVWDTAQDGKPIHVLQHGASLEIFDEEQRERLDTGVKFTAWGTTLDRFYTGGSDGAVNVWNVRNLTRPHVRLLLEAPAPIASGAWSPDMRKLAIGDATGRLWLFSVDKRDAPKTHFMKVGAKLRRCPRPLLLHSDPPPPPVNAAGSYDVAMDIDGGAPGEPEIVAYSAKTYFYPGILADTRNPVIGIVQGQNYALSNLFRREAHLDEDPRGPLLTEYDRHQRASVASTRGTRRRCLRRLKPAGEPGAALEAAHAGNRLADRDVDAWLDEVGKLPEEDVSELNRLGAILRLEDAV